MQCNLHKFELCVFGQVWNCASEDTSLGQHIAAKDTEVSQLGDHVRDLVRVVLWSVATPPDRCDLVEIRLGGGDEHEVADALGRRRRAADLHAQCQRRGPHNKTKLGIHDTRAKLMAAGRLA
jgi:hypothetical protein